MNYNQTVTYIQAKQLIELGIEHTNKEFITVADAISFIKSKKLHIVIIPYDDVFDEYDYVVVSYYYRIYKIDSHNGVSVIAESEHGKSIGKTHADCMQSAITKCIELLYAHSTQ